MQSFQKFPKKIIGKNVAAINKKYAKNYTHRHYYKLHIGKSVKVT